MPRFDLELGERRVKVLDGTVRPVKPRFWQKVQLQRIAVREVSWDGVRERVYWKDLQRQLPVRDLGGSDMAGAGG